MTPFEIISIIIAIVAFLPLLPLFKWIDKRYVHLKDFNALRQVIYDTHVDSYEERIEKIDEDIASLTCNTSRNEIDDALLTQKKSRREKYIRKLERIRT